MKTLVNTIAAEGDHPFNGLQLYRSIKIGKNPATWKPFGRYNKTEDYTYHVGGRSEFQFNFGADYYVYKPKVEVFRYGIAFSLTSDQTLKDPIKIHGPKIKRFNKFLTKNKSYFSGMKMWYYEPHKKIHKYNNVRKITPEMTAKGKFIFIGKYIRKKVNKISRQEIEKMVLFFDYLFPLYKFVEFGDDDKVENKIARLCWNTNGWLKPSGRTGKSKNESYEKEQGYGSEEWLFDRSKIINGYLYGFLEPIHKSYYKYVGKKYNIRFYTIDGETKEKYWVGKINNVEVIDEGLQEKIHKYYNEKGWKNEMLLDLKSAGLNSPKVEKAWNRNSFYPNIRLKVSELKGIFNKPVLIDKPKKYIGAYYYILLDEKKNVDYKDTEDIETGFNPNSGSSKPTKGKNNKGTRSVHKEIELKGKHRDIQNGLLVYLRKKYKGQEVKKESTVNNSRIDLYRKDERGYIFYEVKTYSNIFTCLRVALGQLIEYNCYPDKKYAYKMYLVSDLEPVPKFVKYIKHLNKIINIPLGYIQFDSEQKKILATVI